MHDFDTEALRDWFTTQKRDLPWRENSTPYSVLVSEIMLQQTQVSVVIPYYLRWMERFPSFEALAASPEPEVLKLWEGLGYYSRAKNLKKAAELICREWQGQMPSDAPSLAKIPGVGPYTIGAIQSFAFKLKSPAVDGNVMRVLSRYYAIEADIAKLKTQKNLRALAADILPDEKPWEISEGLIELGAVVCKKVPLCNQCPLQPDCSAFKQDLVWKLPIKTGQVSKIKLNRTVLVLMHKGNLLIRKVPQGEVMAGLHEFPYFETDEETISLDDLQDQIEQKFSMKTALVCKLSTVSHGFTRYEATLKPVVLQSLTEKTPEDYFWASSSDLSNLAFSSGHRRILKMIAHSRTMVIEKNPGLK